MRITIHTFVIMDGKDTTIRNGRIRPFDIALILTGEGGHRLENIQFFSGFTYISVESDGNIIRRNQFGSDEMPTSIGMGLGGVRNRVSENTFYNADIGIVVGGDWNVVSRNVLDRSPSTAMALWVFGRQNLLLRNTAVDGIFKDEHGDCAHNRWIGNTADASDPACILEGPAT